MKRNSTVSLSVHSADLKVNRTITKPFYLAQTNQYHKTHAAYIDAVLDHQHSWTMKNTGFMKKNAGSILEKACIFWSFRLFVVQIQGLACMLTLITVSIP
jgi:hypothetical protein